MAIIYHKITCRMVVEIHILNNIDTLGTWRVCNNNNNSFLSCSSNSSPCSFVICFILAVAWFLISVLSLRYFSTTCNTLWNSVGEISPSCVACEMILAMLSNLLWARSLMELCFSCFTVKVLKDFRVMTVASERSRLARLRQHQRAGQHRWQMRQ